jgi:transcriptional regulator with XRE-family HTH domain
MADYLQPRKIAAGSIRDAREYVGLTLNEVSAALGMEPRELERIEDGDAKVTGEQLRKFGRMYRRPAGWFFGETRFEPGPDLLRQVEGLSEHDRSAVLDFAEFLQGAGSPTAITREQLENPDD